MAAKRKGKKSKKRTGRKRSNKKATVFTIRAEVNLVALGPLSETINIPNAQVLAEFKSGSAFGIELLKVEFFKVNAQAVGAGVGSVPTILSLGIKDWTGDAATPGAFSASRKNVALWNSGPFDAANEIDLTDDDGNGIVIPGTDIIFTGYLLAVDTVDWAATVSYRIKQLPLSQYVNMVNEFLLVA
jgi:hypothetical protein